VKIGRELVAMGVHELSLADTMGMATPKRTRDVVQRFLAEYPASFLSMHMHDTRGTALANVLTALQHGVTIFDSSAGGLGGCPYAPGATGNLATEDLIYMLDGLGIETGIDLAALVEASRFIEAKLGHRLPSRYYRASTAAR
jgi:hydroxymethylglutaryl-CoA lyase